MLKIQQLQKMLNYKNVNEFLPRLYSDVYIFKGHYQIFLLGEIVKIVDNFLTF